MHRTAKLLFTLGVSLAALGVATLLYLAFVAQLPAQPTPATGHLIELDVPGSVRSARYITSAEAWMALRLPLIGVGIGFLAVIVRRIGEGRDRRAQRASRGRLR